MKKLLNIVMIFFALAVSLLLEPGVLQTQPIEAINYFEGAKKETVDLVSNNLYNGEISSYQEKNDQNSSGSSPSILSYQLITDLYSKNRTHLIGCFIHNLSANNQKVHPIRAP